MKLHPDSFGFLVIRWHNSLLVSVATSTPYQAATDTVYLFTGFALGQQVHEPSSSGRANPAGLCRSD
jgi:hypothetical protein